MTADQPRDTEYGDTTSKLWLFLLKSGGRWLSVDAGRGAGVSGIQASQHLSVMARNGNVRQFPVPGKDRRFTYGVTGACKVPRSVRVEDVADCLRAQSEEEVPS